ncbi:MAG TPA: hypothetical protein PKK12_15445 [Candidatus Aminicenantes bacterium]|nr:hypothetical protein [Candidatus Aminicenantes bacterium]
MDEGKFKAVEEKYHALKASLDRKEIGPDDLKRELKKLIVMDESGRYWMIGTKSGQWFMYDGTDWKVGHPYEEVEVHRQPTPPPPARPVPPEPEPAKLVPPLASEGGSVCRFCKMPLPPKALYCPSCGSNQHESIRTRPIWERGGEITLHGVRLLSLASFIGGIGLILGVIAGASFGIFNLAPELLKELPILLRDAHGQVQGGLLFGAAGGITGYLAFALLGIVLGLCYNFIAFVFGGIRFRTR